MYSVNEFFVLVAILIGAGLLGILSVWAVSKRFRRQPDIGTAEDRRYKYMGWAAMIIGLCALAPIPAWLLLLLGSPSRTRRELLERTDHKEIAFACYALTTNRREWLLEYTAIPWDDPRMPPVLAAVTRPLHVTLVRDDAEVWVHKTCGHGYIGFAFCPSPIDTNRFDLFLRPYDVRNRSDDDVLLYSVWRNGNAEPAHPPNPRQSSGR